AGTGEWRVASTARRRIENVADGSLKRLSNRRTKSENGLRVRSQPGAPVISRLRSRIDAALRGSCTRSQLSRLRSMRGRNPCSESGDGCTPETPCAADGSETMAAARTMQEMSMAAGAELSRHERSLVSRNTNDGSRARLPAIG